MNNIMVAYGLKFVLALGIAAFATYLLLHSWQITKATERAWYGIEQQKMKGSARSKRYEAGALFLTSGAILVWLLLNPPELEPEMIAQPSPSPMIQLLTETPVIAELVVTDPVPTLELTRVKNTPVPNPMITDTNTTPLVAIPTMDLGIQAVITNTGGGGLWLRDEPFGNGLVLMPEGSVVFVRGGLMEVDGLNWQRVAESSGREGWVAADFLIYR